MQFHFSKHRFGSAGRAWASLLGAWLAFLPAALTMAQTPEGVPASGRQKVLILRAESGVASDAQRLSVTNAIHAQALRYRQLEAVLSGSDLVEEMFEFECTEAGVDCLSRIGAKYGAQMVVFSELVLSDSSPPTLNMRVVDCAQARVVQSTSQPVPALEKSEAAIARGLVVLLGPVDLPAAQAEVPGALLVVLFGGGVALVYVDEQLAGRTSVSGLRVPLAPGPHTVRVVRAGYREWTGRVTVSPGQTVEQAVQLQQIAEGAVAGSSPSGSAIEPAVPLTRKWWFWTLIGGGVVAGAAVAVALASGSDSVATGTAAFSIEHSEAYLDPIFTGAGGP